ILSQDQTLHCNFFLNYQFHGLISSKESSFNFQVVFCYFFFRKLCYKLFYFNDLYARSGTLSSLFSLRYS
ncbi:hypothetical protein, partial [Apibacter mensalis]